MQNPQSVTANLGKGDNYIGVILNRPMREFTLECTTEEGKWSMFDVREDMIYFYKEGEGLLVNYVALKERGLEFRISPRRGTTDYKAPREEIVEKLRYLAIVISAIKADNTDVIIVDAPTGENSARASRGELPLAYTSVIRLRNSTFKSRRPGVKDLSKRKVRGYTRIITDKRNGSTKSIYVPPTHVGREGVYINEQYIL
jgi:hypothetical protein